MVSGNSMIKNFYRYFFIPGLVAFASGCALTPSTVTHQPNTLRAPQHAAAVSQPNGSILQTVHSTTGGVRYTPLFEDRWQEVSATRLSLR